MTKLDDVILAQKRYEQAVALLEIRASQREDAALEAFNHRTSLIKLADALGVTPGRVSQMLHKARCRHDAEPPDI